MFQFYFFIPGKLQAADKKSKATFDLFIFFSPFPERLWVGGSGGGGWGARHPSLDSMNATFCKQVLFSLSLASFFFSNYP